MSTLWDFVLDRLSPRPAKPGLSRTRSASPPVTRAHASASKTPSDSPASQRYETMQRTMLERYGIRVRKWRSSTSGIAWQVTYADGTTSRMIESPKPRGPISAAVFLHEVGHHAIGFNVYSPRCLEEREAWCFSLDQMDAWQITITDSVRRRVHLSLAYAVEKARRRGLKHLPTCLEPFLHRPVGTTYFDPRASVAKGPS